MCHTEPGRKVGCFIQYKRFALWDPLYFSAIKLVFSNSNSIFSLANKEITLCKCCFQHTVVWLRHIKPWIIPEKGRGRAFTLLTRKEPSETCFITTEEPGSECVHRGNQMLIGKGDITSHCSHSHVRKGFPVISSTDVSSLKMNKSRTVSLWNATFLCLGCFNINL